MNDAEPALQVLLLQPWQANLYEAFRGPVTSARSARTTAHFDGHRRALAVKGDTAAVAGVATPLRQAVLEVAGVEATSARMLARKMKMVMTHRWIWVDHPMTALLIEAAIVSDAAALQLGDQEEARLLRRLRGER